MSTILHFDFVVVLNLLIMLLWPASGRYSGERENVVGIIVLILTVIAVILDIIFLAKQF